MQKSYCTNCHVFIESEVEKCHVCGHSQIQHIEINVQKHEKKNK